MNRGAESGGSPTITHARQERKFAKCDAFLCSCWRTAGRYQALGSVRLILFTAKTRKQTLVFATAADQEMVGLGWT